jgi:Ser/Thr protein kinase RdoA (MazF antagonist)
MQARIKQLYNPSILREAMSRYAIDENFLKPLDGFESFIYKYHQRGQSYILRISHEIHRSESMIHGELSWINYLAKNGVSVAEAIRSQNNKLVETISDNHGNSFVVAAFIEAKGITIRSGEWTAELMANHGQLLGSMHALSKQYQPPEKNAYRLHWNDPTMLEVEGVLPDSETVVLEKYHSLMTHLEQLDCDSESYGLIHQDAHTGNFLVTETGKITLFDFDDATYSWFVNDIAIVLFYAVMWEKEKVKFTKQFLSNFLRGYSTRNTLESHWFKEIPYFLKLREIDLYAVIHRSFDVNNLDDPWVKNFMDGRKQRLEKDVPYLDKQIDFESIAKDMII